MTDSTKAEKIALLVITGVIVVAVTWIARDALKMQTVDANGATLIGVIVTGLLAMGKDIITAVRGYSMSAQLGKVTDQLAASGPASANDIPTGKPDDPVSVTETGKK